MHREATRRNEEYVQEVEDRRRVLRDIHANYTNRVRDERLKMENRKSNHLVMTEEAKGIIQQFPMQLRQYQNHLNFLRDE